MFCRAAITDGKGNFTLEEIEVTPPEGDEVLVQVKAAGICHTDWNSLTWGKQMILGHEGAGMVVEVGPDVSSVTPSDKVLLNWAIPCGRCFQCREGNESICTGEVLGSSDRFNKHAGSGRSLRRGSPIERSFNLGTMSEFTVVREAAVVRTLSEIPFPSAAIIGCGVMTGVGSVLNVAVPSPGATIVVLGAGGVGLNVIQGARIASAVNIIAVDVNPGRLEMAKRFGATQTILAEPEDKGLLAAARQVHSVTGRGADYAFECTAIPELGAAPLAMVRNGGMAVQVSGIEQEITFDMRLFEWDKVYINPLYGKCRPQKDFPLLVSLYEAGDLLLDELVTTTYPLDSLEQAFADMLVGQNAKGVIVF